MNAEDIKTQFYTKTISLKEKKRLDNALKLVPWMCASGFRFSKTYRNKEGIFQAFVFSQVNTVFANIMCEVS